MVSFSNVEGLGYSGSQNQDFERTIGFLCQLQVAFQHIMGSSLN